MTSITVGLDDESADRLAEKAAREGVAPDSIRVPRPGFAYGTWSVAVTPTGRLLASGSRGGLACSADGGATWATTCATPDGA